MHVANHVPNPQDGRYSSRYLSRKRVVNWGESAYTVLTNARDISIHPGQPEEAIELRHYDVTPQLADNGFTVAEFFAGGGLMATGLVRAGYNIVWANDFERSACAAYRYNLGDHIVHGDITQIPIDDIPDADVYAGGPPCQDFSIAGDGAGEDGERGKLVWSYLSIIEWKQPKAFVFENVKGLTMKRHIHTFQALLARFDEIGYNVSFQLVNAWDYGVAQKRERVFIVGIRKDIGFTFRFPDPDPALQRSVVLRDVIGDLPEPHGIGLSEKAAAYMERDPRHLAKHRPPTYDEAVPTYDEAVPTLPAVLHKGVPYGLFYPENHVQTRSTTVKPTDQLSFQRSYVADIGGPGRTVNCGRLDHAEIHPSQPRRFTVRECLRIQSVPDSYVLPDGISLSAQYRIVGNGVATRVAYIIGDALATQLREATSC